MYPSALLTVGATVVMNHKDSRQDALDGGSALHRTTQTEKTHVSSGTRTATVHAIHPEAGVIGNDGFTYLFQYNLCFLWFHSVGCRSFLYSSMGELFESWPSHRTSWGVLRFSSVFSDRCRGRISIRPREIPSKSSLSRHSSIILHINDVSSYWERCKTTHRHALLSC
jgi:hypothetical protein